MGDPDWRCMDPIEHGDFRASYVSLAEGNPLILTIDPNFLSGTSKHQKAPRIWENAGKTLGMGMVGP